MRLRKASKKLMKNSVLFCLILLPMAKSRKKVLSAMTKIHDVPYMIVSANPDKKNISCFSSVSKTHHEKSMLQNGVLL